MKVYISGPITHNPHYIQDFKEAERTLRYVRAVPINPTTGEQPGQSWGYYMKRDIKMLMDADAIYMLNGWRFSRGARLERHIAKAIGLRIVYQTKSKADLYIALHNWKKK